MARNTRPAPKGKSDVVFLQCDLDKALKKQLQEWITGEHDYFDMIEKCVDSRLKFGAGFDDYNECFQASLTQVATLENGGITRILVGRGGNLLQAMQSLFFKYHVMLETHLDDLERQNPRGVSDWG